MLDKDGVRLTVDDAIATVTLTNPAKRNAQTPALWRALAEAGRSLPGTVRVVVLRGEGKSFSAGLDRQAFTPEGFDGEPSFIDLARGSRRRARRDHRRVPGGLHLVAAQRHRVHRRRAGACHRAGFQLALACDLRVVADDVQFAMRETSLGPGPRPDRHAPAGRPGRLRPRAGDLRHRAASCTPRRPSAPAWPTSSCPPTSSTTPSRDLAAALLAAPRDAVIETKALLRGRPDRTYEEQRAAERAAQARRLRDLAGRRRLRRASTGRRRRPPAARQLRPSDPRSPPP